MILLATDLDGTLVGDIQATQKFFELVQPLRERQELKLVYASGRSLEKYVALQNEQNLEKPDALISAVGTEIYIGNDFKPLEAWQQIIGKNWDREAIVKKCLNTVDLELDAETEQRPFKITFVSNTPGEHEASKLKQVLREIFPDVVVLTSHAGKYIDIVPMGSDKGMAVHYLAGLWGVEHENIIAAGDSANDSVMLCTAKAIVVGNAFEELRALFTQHPELPVYFAEKSYAAGIIEGLEHYLDKNRGMI